MVVLTQKVRCKHIPKKNKLANVYIKFVLKKKDTMSAPIIVIITSIIAIYQIRGMSECLHQEYQVRLYIYINSFYVNILFYFCKFLTKHHSHF